ncbi:MAG: bifunctional UDP-N-acetylglucosamine diphosphorylase/glucosamine-1-phosphate N-acetyltransferase GlmU [Actinobacteria bacterium]|nr:bifunctional UDP-N-acetylglucosamine diphosphorylase/glucosamine-1-phosphate N-acetyltransferase GlmU [Actinomycetota bacterium]
MTQTNLAAVVMAGGLGTRMRSAVPKHLQPLLGRRMVDWVLEAARPLAPTRLVVVASPESRAAFGDVEVAVQERALGTGDAIRSARAALEGAADEVLVLSGDTPLLTADLLEQLVQAHRDAGAAATVLTFLPDDLRSYGRVLRGAGGNVSAIVEASDATPEQLVVRECNSSIYVFRAELLWPALERLQPANAQGELYLTDAVRDLVESGASVGAHIAADPDETEGVNTRVELAAAAAALRDRINEAHMLAGVAIADPSSTWIEPGVELEPDCVVHPFTVLRGATRVAAGAEIGPHAVAIDATVGAGALVGPFCYLRPGTVLEANAKAGTFVEIKNSHIGAGAKVPHLSYIGDAEIGEGTNIGAGTITANFPHQPGRPKGRTSIGKNVRTAIHTSLMAPVEIGDNSWTAAGSVITDDVPPDSLAGFAPRQETKEGYLRGNRDD